MGKTGHLYGIYSILIFWILLWLFLADFQLHLPGFTQKNAPCLTQKRI
jgi:hypothetical protein